MIKGQERVCVGCERECVWGENWTKECVWDESRARERECVCGVRMGQERKRVGREFWVKRERECVCVGWN